MAKVTVKLSAKLKWWALPLINVLVFLRYIGIPFNEVEIAERIVKKGVFFTIDGKRIT